MDYNNPEHVKYFCDIHTQPPLPDPGEIWDDSLDKLKEFFEGLIPGNNNENNQNQGNPNEGVEGENDHNEDNHYDDFEDEYEPDETDFN